MSRSSLLAGSVIACVTAACSPPSAAKQAHDSVARAPTVMPVATNACHERALDIVVSVREVRIEALVGGDLGTSIRYISLRRSDTGFVGAELSADFVHNQPPAQVNAQRLKLERNNVERLLAALQTLALDTTLASTARRAGLGTDNFPSARIVASGQGLMLEFSSDMAKWQVHGSCKRDFSPDASVRAEQTFAAFLESIP